MARPRMRPSFRIETACSAETLMETIRSLLERDADEVVGTLSRRHCLLRVPPSDQRIWTPCLELTVDEQARPGQGANGSSPPTVGPTRLWGTFSPKPEIWTACVFTFGTLAIVSLFTSMYGFAQLALGRAPFALLVPLVAVVLAVLVYLGALVGQGLSISEMYRLRAFVDDCLREAERGSDVATQPPEPSFDEAGLP